MPRRCLCFRLTGLCNRVSHNQDGDIPPTGNLLVDLQFLIVRIVDMVLSFVPWVQGQQEGLNVVPVEEQNMSKHRAEGQVRRDQVKSIGSGEVSGPEFGVLHGIEFAVGQKRSLVVLRPVLGLCTSKCEQHASAVVLPIRTHEDSLTHERELLRLPQVAVVHRGHEDIREDNTDILVQLQPERRPQAGATDQVPVQAQCE